MREASHQTHQVNITDRNDTVKQLVFQPSVRSQTKRSDEDPTAKKAKLLSREAKVREQLEVFVQNFINAFIKRLATYYLAAKGERLTEEALKAELKTGTTAALIGIAIARGVVGSIPAALASIRTLSSHYYLPRGKAQKITKAFETVARGELSQLLAIAAVEIFQSFERQFMYVTDKAGDKMAMEKLAEDAAGRALNYIAEDASVNNPISSELITQAIILGKSEKFFDPSLKRVRIRISGNLLQDSSGNPINTANLYEKIGLIISHADNKLNKFYKVNDRPDSTRYGYRRLLSWEKDEQGELKAAYQANYAQEIFPQQETTLQYSLRRYDYILQSAGIQQESTRILTTIRNLYPDPQGTPIVQQSIARNPVLFDLRKPVENFTGRTSTLNELHRVLLSGKATVIIAQSLSALSINSPASSHAHSSSSQAAISGLGGIGKTQLALRYAELHAADYDQHVLWINAETITDCSNSLKKLATKLMIATKDSYGIEKDLEEISTEIYTYFSTGKSLFIFDNVGNYKEIAPLLPKVQIGNKPTILITSRYQNWKNIATVVSLDVFTEEETQEFIKTELGILDNTQDRKIKELNGLLQGLPLVLQQAVAYIDNQRNINSQFGVSDYVELYKIKSQEMLSFDLASYSNDPYTRTVLITWQVTLDKIKQYQAAGEVALEILNIMAYICPDTIASSFFFPFQNSATLATAIHLLKSYSMINQGSQQDLSTIHRLVQQVVRIHLEKDPNEFKKTAEKIIYLIGDYTRSKDNLYHYLHFLLHMTQHPKLTQKLNLRATQKRILDILTFSEYDTNSLVYWFDTAQLLFSKKVFLKFIGEALFVYTHKGMLFLLTGTMEYIEKKLAEGALSKAEIREILDIKYTVSGKEYKRSRLSPVEEERKRQFDAVRLIYEFEHKLFPPQESSTCSSLTRKKRNADCLSLEGEESIATQAEQTIKQHLQKVSQIARLVSSGIFTKDTLAALIQGNFSTVAINFGLLSSSTILGEISNKLLTQGEVLSSAEVLLLEKNLDLNSKLALSILTDQEVLSTGKRRFLGNSMKMAAPFLARGTSVFFAYQLINQIKAYKSGNKKALHDMTTNGIMLGIDGLESGVEAAEYLELIEGISAFTGPLGEAAVALVWLESDLHHVKQQVAAIEKYVHLNREEKIMQDVRAFLHLAPSAYIEVKARNNQRIKNAIAFLKMHTEIKRYIFSTEHPNSEVFLNNQATITISETMPDAPSVGSLFCLSGFSSSRIRPDQWVYIEPYPPFLGESDEVSIYLCKNALGVEYALNRTGNATLISLDAGDDTVIGGTDFPSIFLVNNGKKNYSCGNKDCLFILQGEHITGTLQGGSGTNIINLDGLHPQTNRYLLLDEQGLVCGKNVSYQITDQQCASGLKLTNIQQIYGRKNKKDVIYMTETLEYLDGQRGESQDYPDHIYITNKSNRNPKIVLRTNTVVHCLESNLTIDTVDYRIPNDQSGETSVQLLFTASIQHRFYFDFSVADLKTIMTQDNKITFNFFFQQRLFNVTIIDPYRDLRRYHDKTMHYPEFPDYAYYLFQDHTEIKLLNRKNIYAQQRSNKTLAEIVRDYPSIASRLNMMLSIQQLVTNETVLIGHGKHVILHNNAFAKTHLIGNGDENIYVVRAAINHTDPFPLPEVTLHHVNKEQNFIDTLDLRDIVQQAQQTCTEQKITPSVSEQGQDLVLSLNAHDYRLSNNSCVHFSMSTWSTATVRLKNALVDNWYQQLDIKLHDVPMNIILSDQGWRLEQLPLVFDRDKEIIIVTDKDIGKAAELIILKNMGRYDFIRHNETDLIITNALDPNTTQANLCTIIASQFYQLPEMQEKLLSATLTFIDQQIILKNHAEQINNASNFYKITTEYTEQAYNRTLKQSNVSINQAHVLLSNKPSRRKRQIANKALIANPEDVRIETITEHYLEKYDYHLNKAIPFSKTNRKKIKPTAHEPVARKAKFTEQHDTHQASTSQETHWANQQISSYPTLIKNNKKLLRLKNPIQNSRTVVAKQEVSHTQMKLFRPKQDQKKLATHPVKYLTGKQNESLLFKANLMRPALTQQDKVHHNQMPLSRVTATSDVTATLFALNVLTRMVTREKYRPALFTQGTAKHSKVEKQMARSNARLFGLPNTQRLP